VTLERIQRDGRVLATDLAQEFQTSEDTSHRALRGLAAQGLCTRVYGGVLAMSPASGSVVQRRRVRRPVIDDDHRVRESLINLLNSRGLHVGAYSSALKFLQSDTIANVHCVISDIVMDGMDGLELCRLLSQCYLCLPVILISGRDHSVIQRGDFAGSTFLQKPLDADEVIRAVSVALANKG
jgi:CheY-like chemotaxis protein